MTGANDLLHSDVAGSFQTLDDALQHAHFSTARKLAATLNSPEHFDQLLALLVQHARSAPQALELLLEFMATFWQFYRSSPTAVF